MTSGRRLHTMAIGADLARRSRALIVSLLAAGLLAGPISHTVAAGTSSTSVRPERPGPEHRYRVHRGPTPGLADHTLLRPADLTQVRYRMPIVAWANGGCRESNMEVNYFLTHLAAYGYFIVANGSPDNPYDPLEVTGMARPAPEKLTAGISWALAQNTSPSSPYFRRLDARRVVVMGQSCGGYEALRASTSDPRAGTAIIWNSGTDPQDPTAVTRLRSPVLFADGGATDVMHWDAATTYELTAVPAVFASLSGAGHSGMWADPAPPASPPGPYQTEPLIVAHQWVMLTLYASRSGRSFFLGPDCGLCRRAGWSVQYKNWPAQPTRAPGGPGTS